jgi:nitrate/nitrite transporter NarK
MMSIYQFLTNIGWAFLVLSLPDYLKRVVHLDEETSGKITTAALTIGILALPLGGYISDVCSKRFGKRIGRTLPLVLTRFLAAGCYFAAMSTDSHWLMAIAFGGVAFFADLALPAVWAIMQDISGKHQAQLFGWANMWGNFGAFLQPVMFAYVLKQFDANHNYHPGMWFCACAFVIAGFVAFFINSDKPIVAADH